MGRGNDPTPLGIGERETVGLHLQRGVVADGPGVVVRNHERDVVREEWISRFGELSRRGDVRQVGHSLAEEVQLPIGHVELSLRPDVRAP